MKKVLSLLLVLTAALSFVGCSNSEEIPEACIGAPGRIGEEVIKVAVIKNLGNDEHAAQILAGAIEEGESLGFEVTTMVTKDHAEFEDQFNQVLIQDYDAIFYTHAPAEKIVGLVERALEKGMVVAGFDSAETPYTLDNVVSTKQDDYEMARLSLQALVDHIDPDGTRTTAIPILEMLVDGFGPQIARESVLTGQFIDTDLLTVSYKQGEVGDWSNVAGINADSIPGIISANQEIEAIWAAWDAFATGAYTGLPNSSNPNLPIFSVDVSNADLQKMQEEGSNWLMTAAADAKAVGIINMRMIAIMLAGGDVESTFELPITAIYSVDLIAAGGEITVATLTDVYPTWGSSDVYLRDWMTIIKDKIQ